MAIKVILDHLNWVVHQIKIGGLKDQMEQEVNLFSLITGDHS